jgi:UDP-N-acetylmuramate--alanine ligase
MPLFTPKDPRPLHLMGVGGAGMSALALIARRRGVTVTGCDLSLSGARDLVRAGVQVLAGHDPSHVVGARAVVHTAAVPADHPELAAARAARIPVVRRADALQAVVSGGAVVGVAGTHGKTTTTAMVAEALAATGAQPTCIAGGRVAAWGGNVRFGGDELFVVEADEYDRAFLALRPTWAVVNNVEADHLECYGSLAALEAAFAEFAGRAQRVLIGGDDPGARRVGEALEVPVWRVGTDEGAECLLRDVRTARDRSAARLTLPDGREVLLELVVPGVHNLRNAAMAVSVALAVGGDPERAVAALAEFAGVGRRFDVVGSRGGVTVVDDYAHHPTELVATLEAARQRFPEARLVAVFQPHLYSRTQMHGEALGRALGGADVAVVTAVYPAREQPIPGVTGEAVAQAARRAGARVQWVPERSELVERVSRLVTEGDVVLTIGAGDITEVGPALLQRLAGAPA